MVLVDFHPKPEDALCDGPQALLFDEFDLFARDIELVRQTYLQRCELARR
jgi:3-deoxy-7-phosphoheptulonate synthase